MIVNFILDYRPGVGVIIEKGPHKNICGKVSIFFKTMSTLSVLVVASPMLINLFHLAF